VNKPAHLLFFPKAKTFRRKNIIWSMEAYMDDIKMHLEETRPTDVEADSSHPRLDSGNLFFQKWQWIASNMVTCRMAAEALCFFELAKAIQIVRRLSNLVWGDATTLCSKLLQQRNYASSLLTAETNWSRILMLYRISEVLCSDCRNKIAVFC
jgi:hypothetical protein